MMESPELSSSSGFEQQFYSPPARRSKTELRSQRRREKKKNTSKPTALVASQPASKSLEEELTGAINEVRDEFKVEEIHRQLSEERNRQLNAADAQHVRRARAEFKREEKKTKDEEIAGEEEIAAQNRLEFGRHLRQRTQLQNLEEKNTSLTRINKPVEDIGFVGPNEIARSHPNPAETGLAPRENNTASLTKGTEQALDSPVEFISPDDFKKSHPRQVRTGPIIDAEASDKRGPIILPATLEADPTHGDAAAPSVDTGVINPVDTAAPQVDTAAPQEQQPDPAALAARLAEARMEYLSAKQRWQDSLKLINSLRGDQRDRALEQYHLAERNYREARAEYIGTDVERFLQEKEDLLAAEVAIMSVGKGFIKKAYDQYKKLGEFNLLEQGAKLFGRQYKAQGRLAKMVNARTALSLGLIATGVGFGAGSAVGAIAVTGRRFLSGAGTAVGSYDLSMLVRNSRGRKEIERELARAGSPWEVEELLAQMAVRAGLDGKNGADLKTDDLYVRASDKYKGLVEREAGGRDAASMEAFFDARIESAEKVLMGSETYEKNIRRTVGAGALLAGVTVGSGMLARALGHKTELMHSQPAAADTPAPGPGGFHHPPLESHPIARELRAPSITNEHSNLLEKPAIKESLLHHGKPTGASVEFNSDGSGVVHSGTRGLEGILDLETSNPEQYNKMITWLQDQPYNKGITKPGALIHRYMEDYAHKHGTTIEKLSRITKGDIHMGADGSLSMDPHDITLMAEHAAHHAPAAADLSQDHIAPANIPETHLPDAHVPTEISSPAALSSIPDYGGEVDSLNTVSKAAGLTEQLNNTPELAVDSVKKASDALQLILESDSKRFLKQAFKLSPTDLDRIGNQTITSFLEKFTQGSEVFRGQFNGLFESFSDEVKQQGSPRTIRQFVLAAARNYKK